MGDDLDAVKTVAAGRLGYHHGDLRAALIAATMEIVEEVGPDGFSLRAAARRAGVSPAAPAHHFRDARGLLTAVATIGFIEFGDALEAAGGSNRRSTITALSHVYLNFALKRPGLFRLMWRKQLLDCDDGEHIAAAARTFTISDRAVRGNAASFTAPDDPALAPTIACWSMVHGFVSLILDGAFFASGMGTPKATAKLLDAMLLHFKANFS